jgi:hypothetical protein
VQWRPPFAIQGVDVGASAQQSALDPERGDVVKARATYGAVQRRLPCLAVRGIGVGVVLEKELKFGM